METSEHLEFYVHDDKHKVRAEDVPASLSLLDYLRDKMHLTGTKAMCREGGCGACIVAATFQHPCSGKEVTLAVNSCLVNVFSCSGWKISTVEGLGHGPDNYHVIQKTLADNNGTQCGFCSSGMVMNMYALQKSNKFTQAEIENNFGGNICRCTGYRPILDGFRKLASDKDPDDFDMLADIEDVRACLQNGLCKKVCETPCSLYNPPVAYATQEVQWYKVFKIDEILEIFKKNPTTLCKLVAGNTAKGVYWSDFGSAPVCIDINSVKELKDKEHNTNEVKLGGNVTLTEAMDYFVDISKKDSAFKYLAQLQKHIDLVAHVPVRNIGTLAGNLMIKHTRKEFPSDIFLLLTTIDATLTIVDTNGGVMNKNMEEFLNCDMNKRVIKSIQLPKFTGKKYFDTYKIMPRAQNAHAMVNAGFLLNMDDKGTKVKSARIVYGNINPKFVRASLAETSLVGKDPFTDTTMQGVFKALSKEIVPDYVLPDPKPEFRKELAMALYYKFMLSNAPTVKEEYKSGGQKLTRDVLSKGTQTFKADANKDLIPIGSAINKLEGRAQTSGEAEYIPDIPDQPGQLHGVFVLCRKPAGTIIKKQDATEAKKVDGVVDYINVSDIVAAKGQNVVLPLIPGIFADVDKLFAEGTVEYYNQPIGMILAKDRATAERAARLVVITYQENKAYKPVIKLRDAIAKNEKVVLQSEHIASQPGTNVKHTIKGKFDISWQYHYHMETHTCVVVPLENQEFDIYSSTQWMDMTQLACSVVSGLPVNKLNFQVRRLGGGYGAKISRANYATCAAVLGSKKTRKPVRVWMSLTDNMDVIGKRNPLAANYTIDIDDEGAIQLATIDTYTDIGTSGNDAPYVMVGRTILDAFGDKVLHHQLFSAKTDNPPATWTRSPGSLEGVAVSQYIFEHIANFLKKDPWEVQMKNFNKKEHEVLAKIMDGFDAYADLTKRKADIEAFNKKNRWRKRGLALSPLIYYVYMDGQFNVIVTIFVNDGTVAVSHGGTEMGQGINTKAAQVVANSLGIPMSDIIVKPSNTLVSPNTSTTGGSITSESVCQGLQQCCKQLKDQIDKFPGTWVEQIAAANAAGVNLCNSYMWKNSYDRNYTIYAALAAEIELDVLTGNHIVRRIDLVEDTGDSMNPIVDMGQVEGAFMMSYGYWTTEQIIMADDGELMTNSTWTYKPPGIRDIPLEFNVKFPEGNPNAENPFKAKATAEPPMCVGIAVAFAIKNAVKSARLDADPIKGGDWIAIDGPLTVEKNFMSCEPDFTKYTLN